MQKSFIFSPPQAVLPLGVPDSGGLQVPGPVSDPPLLQVTLSLLTSAVSPTFCLRLDTVDSRHSDNHAKALKRIGQVDSHHR